MINNIHKTSKVKQNLVNIKGQMVNINNIAELELKLFLAGTFQNFWQQGGEGGELKMQLSPIVFILRIITPENMLG